MIPEIGILSLCLALIFALYQGMIPIVAKVKKQAELYRLSPWVAILQFIFLILAFICLAESFLDNDFTIMYVARQSSLSLPWYYKLAAVWGGHEGSLLLWIIIVAGWTSALTLFNKSMPIAFKATVLSVLGWMNVGFYLFLLITSQPFARQFNQVPIDGADLNPILQDPGLLFHPPMLYMGYVGFAITFALAIAGLLHKRFDSNWARWCKPWVMLSWSSLTLGIVLGSWWAYHVLGWGGWWFWDPVENASLLPWLLATALLHVLIVTEKREELISWTVLLAILTYCLSLLGTFLVRSGVLISVHAFATDPSRGVFLLVYLFFAVLLGLMLFAWRLPYMKQYHALPVLSRSAMLLLNSIVLIVITATILVGTIYPLVLESLNLGKISVGLPYFNRVFVPLSIPLLGLMGVGSFCFWHDTKLKSILKKVKWPFYISIFLMLTFAFFAPTPHSIIAYLGIFMGTWVISTTIVQFIQQKSPLSMIFAHMGIGIMAIAITIATNYGVSKDILMEVGDSMTLGPHRVVFETVKIKQGENYKALQGIFKIDRKTTVISERRLFSVTQQIISEAGIVPGFFSDIYIVLGSAVEDVWSVRMYYKPMIRWIWLGGLFMLSGGLLTFIKRPKTYCQWEKTYDSI